MCSNFSLNELLHHKEVIVFLISALVLYQRSGVQQSIRKAGCLTLISSKLAELESSIPRIPSTYFNARGQIIPAQGEKKARVERVQMAKEM